MDLEQFLPQDPTGGDAGLQLPDITSSIQDALAPLLLTSVVITGFFAVLYILSILRRRKVERAIFDIQKTIHEMNERDKARSALPAAPTPPENPPRGNDLIAKEDTDEPAGEPLS